MTNALPQFDLHEVMEQIKADPVYSDWPSKRLTEAEKSYRDFIASCKASKTAVIPSPDADTVWHRHILNTRKYANDSQNFFGFFLHHRPDTMTERQAKSARAATCGNEPEVALCQDDPDDDIGNKLAMA